MEVILSPRSLLEEKALRSFKGLLEVAKEHPKVAHELISRLAQEQPAYPTSYAAMFLLGAVLGACTSYRFSLPVLLSSLKLSHGDLLDLKPLHYLGKCRKHGIHGG